MNPLAYFKISNNEDCPCGSGKKFKECCKGKPDQQLIQSKKPPEVQIMEQMRKAMVKCCMHPDQSNCNGKIKNAHALQNNKIISLLAGKRTIASTCSYASFSAIIVSHDTESKKLST